jgi:hypothetical protein
MLIGERLRMVREEETLPGRHQKTHRLAATLTFPEGEHGHITPTIQTLEKLHALLRLNSCVASDTNSRVSGSVSGNTVSLTATYAGVSVSLGGTVSGNTIAGNYTASGACGADSGTWTATKMPQINGNYSGNLFSNSNPSQAIPVTASIAADSKLAITGNASVSSVCFNQLALSGTQVGGAGQIVGTDPKGDSVTFLFISKDAAFGSVGGVYSVTAGPTTCAGDSGTGSLTKM